MAKPNSSWKVRRWKLFTQVYNTNEEYKNKLSQITPTHNDGVLVIDDRIDEIEAISAKFGIPSACKLAIAVYLLNPNLGSKKYEDTVIPPFTIWSGSRNYFRLGNVELSAAEMLKMRLNHAKKLGNISFDIDNIKYEELARAIGLETTTLEIMPGVNKSEIKDFIDEFDKEFQELLKPRDNVDDYSYSSNLQGKVYKPKTAKQQERDNLILRLTDEGLDDTAIAWELQQAKHGNHSTANIRKIRSRLRSNK